MPREAHERRAADGTEKSFTLALVHQPVSFKCAAIRILARDASQSGGRRKAAGQPRLAAMPEKEVGRARESPAGIGGAGAPPVVPPVVNVIDAATGKRLRWLAIDAPESNKA